MAMSVVALHVWSCGGDGQLFLYVQIKRANNDFELKPFFRDFTNVLKSYHVNTNIQTWN